MDYKNRAFAKFLDEENVDYLQHILQPEINRGRLIDAMTRYLRTHVQLVDNFTDVWVNVRTLNKVFLDEFNPCPNVDNSYSSFGEADFLNNQVYYGDLYKMEERKNDIKEFLWLPNDLSKEKRYRYVPCPRRPPWNL